jgi:hypothetical protein
MLIGAAAGGLLAFFEYRTPLDTQAAAVVSGEAGVTTISATAPSDTKTEDREERLASLRQKLKNRTLEIFTPPVEEPVVEIEEEEVVETELETEMKCSQFAAFSGSWDSRGLKVADREGVRQVYRETLVGTSTTPTKTVLLEIPLRSKPVAKTCIPSDVVAISVNGSLIRNNDARAYAGTAPDTMIGYTLDGYPLYGGLAVSADACGGAVVAGQYRYGLQAERDTILRCFVATPISL